VRFIAVLTYILPQELQEEWLGDWQEQHYKLIVEGCPQWRVTLKTILWSFGLVWSLCCIKSQNLVSSARDKQDQ
jgi:hypothetical protein